MSSAGMKRVTAGIGDFVSARCSDGEGLVRGVLVHQNDRGSVVVSKVGGEAIQCSGIEFTWPKGDLSQEIRNVADQILTEYRKRELKADRQDV